MSKLTLFLLLSLITFVINQWTIIGNITLQPCGDLSIEGYTPAQLIEELEEEYCESLKTTGEDYTHCCYFEFSSNSGCYQITDDQYENIGRFKKYLRDQADDDDIGIDCSSRFISFSLLAVLALLF